MYIMSMKCNRTLAEVIYNEETSSQEHRSVVIIVAGGCTAQHVLVITREAVVRNAQGDMHTTKESAQPFIL